MNAKTSNTNAPVDVLAVLAKAYHHLAYVADASEAGSIIVINLSDAHAAVAELIEAAHRLTIALRTGEADADIALTDTMAALARCKGGV